MKKILTLPLKNNDEISKLRIGEIFYISGTIVTGRDEVYHRVVEEGIQPLITLSGLASYHAGPIVKEKSKDDHDHLPSSCQTGWELVSIGPTTSARMEKWAADFIKKTGIKIMIGKGGMGADTTEACKKHKAIHCVYPGGCAVLGASQIEKIETVFWQEFGMAECMWVMKAVELGPLIVSIDTHGGNLFEENKKHYHKTQIFTN